MFASLVTTVVLAGSIAMPTVSDNPWATNDWAPLKAEYAACQESMTSYFSYYVCTIGAREKAITSTVKA